MRILLVRSSSFFRGELVLIRGDRQFDMIMESQKTDTRHGKGDNEESHKKRQGTSCGEGVIEESADEGCRGVEIAFQNNGNGPDHDIPDHAAADSGADTAQDYADGS